MNASPYYHLLEIIASAKIFVRTIVEFSVTDAV